jgi:hypothetical protein
MVKKAKSSRAKNAQKKIKNLRKEHLFIVFIQDDIPTVCPPFAKCFVILPQFANKYNPQLFSLTAVFFRSKIKEIDYGGAACFIRNFMEK